MQALESLAVKVRRSAPLRSLTPVWNLTRPVYRGVLSAVARGGLERNINGQDSIRVSSRLYTLGETYEPEMWTQLMGSLRPGCVFVDVGACLGLYAVAAARRCGPQGRVVAFEPEPSLYRLLVENLSVNRLEGVVDALALAVGDRDGEVAFRAGRGAESRVVLVGSATDGAVTCVKLDSVLDGTSVDVMKIDVEGYEDFVVSGAQSLLSDEARAPSVVFIEVHPQAWPAFGTSGQSMLARLERLGYSVVDLAGNPVDQIVNHGIVVARRRGRP
jgi:FkbM family methyltransferase